MIIIRNDSKEEGMPMNYRRLDYFCGLFGLLLLFFLDIFIISLVRFLMWIFFLEEFLLNVQVFIERVSNRSWNNASTG